MSEVPKKLGFSPGSSKMCGQEGAEQATRAKAEGRSKEQDGIKAKKIIQVLSHPSATAPRASPNRDFTPWP